MEGWIEVGVWAALVGAAVWLAWPRDAEPRWVRFVERGLPVRGRWARRLIAVPFLVMSLFPLAQGFTYGNGHSFLVRAGDWGPCLGCLVASPPAPQGISQSGHSWYGRPCQIWSPRIGNWQLQIYQFADVDTT